MEDKRKRYKITCPYCQKVQYACKSILHEMGMYDCGHGTCLDCKATMRLVYNGKTDTMTAKVWE